MANVKNTPAKVAAPAPAKVAAPAPAPAPASNAPAALLFATANAPVTANTVRAWVNQHCGGNYHKVAIVVQPTVAANWHAQGLKGPVPFGYNGGPTGTRAVLQNKFLTSATLGGFMQWCKVTPSVNHAETLNRLVITLAMLNGGYSPSAKTWGQSFVHLAPIA